MKLLQKNSTLPIERAQMRVRVSIPSVDGERMWDKVLANAAKVESEEKGEETWEAVSRLVHLLMLE